MKLCQSCGQRPAAVEFIQVMGDTRREISLCRECAVSQGMAAQLAAFGQLTQQILANLKLQGDVQTPAVDMPAVPCETCGLSFEEFLSSGLLGCPDCYPEFEHALNTVLRRLHGVAHRAVSEDIAQRHEALRRHPEDSTPVETEARAKEHRREELEVKIELALLEENYELAAKLRDELKLL
jgi:protein arginine kinase activator